MFYYLNGTVAEIEGSVAAIDIGGVGYLCFVSANTASRLEIGKTAKLYTYCNIREDAFEIYAFYNKSEKRCFELLIGISGVGPKAALAILSVCTPESLTAAVINNDEKAITMAAGVGKKLAQRVIMELKDKITKEFEAAEAANAPANKNNAAVSQASAALQTLGYTQSEINSALRSIDTTGLSTEDIIRQALKLFMK